MTYAPTWDLIWLAAAFVASGLLGGGLTGWRLAERAYRPTGRHAYHAPEPEPEPERDPPPRPGHDDTVTIYADITGPIPRIEDDPDWVSRLPAEEPIEWGRQADPYLTRLTAETEADVLRAMIRLDEDVAAFMAQRAAEFEATRSMLALAGPR